MKRSIARRASVCLCAFFVFLFSQVQSTRAGWSGMMNGIGYGVASVNVTSSSYNSGTAQTLYPMTGPSAAMTYTYGYSAGAPLPLGSSSSTVARVKGSFGYVWQAYTIGMNGDYTDNTNIDKLINLEPALCPSLEMNSTAIINSNGQGGVLTVNLNGTAGTAILLRGYEYTNPVPPTSVEDLETNEGSSLKWSILLTGPISLNESNCTALNLPITGNITNFYVVNDGEAKSLPLEIYCPSDVKVNCGQTVEYPTVYYRGCGDVTAEYNPPPGTIFPIGTTPVTVTITNQYGDSTNCTFNVIVQDNTPPVPTNLPALYGECSVQVPTPTAIDVCGASSNIVQGTTTDPTFYDNQGTYTVHWKFIDGSLNVTSSNQTIVVKDVTPPVKPTLPDLTYSCDTAQVTPPTPTTTDNCARTVTGTTTTTFPITSPGTNVVTWTFNDGNGNTTTATQNVIITGYTFSGFYAPVNGLGGSCSSPVVTINQGSVEPFKFDFSCGSTPITSGTPPQVFIQAYSHNCTPGTNVVNALAEYQNNWHYNWDTTGWDKGVYNVIVLLPDGSTQNVFVKLK